MQIDILKQQRPYSSRLIPGINQLFFLVFIGILFFSGGYFDISQPETQIPVSILILGVSLLSYYKDVYQPAQYSISHIFTRDNTIHITSSFRDREQQEAVFDYKHISCRYNPSGIKTYRKARVDIKVSNPGEADFETRYIITSGRDWKVDDLRQFEDDFTKWKSELLRNNPLA
jgi:hypothetical protein